MRKDFVLPTIGSEVLNVSAFGNSNSGSNPCIIIIHGFKGFKDWGFFPYTAEYLSQQGFFVLTFNFSHNGIGQNFTEFTELDKFAKNTFSLESAELELLIQKYLSGYFCVIKNKKIGLIGHSRGGAISVLTAKRMEEVSSVVLWASVSNLDRYSKRQKEKWRKEGKFDVLNMRTKQLMSLNTTLLEDIENNGNSSLNIQNAVVDLNRPLLIAHGAQDMAVPVKEAIQLYDWSDKKNTELFIIPATGHTFDTKHPFEGSNLKFNSLLEKTNYFLKQNLN